MTSTTPTTPQELLDYWPGNIPFKGSLVSYDGTCMCAQGQALHFLDGMSVEQLRDISQRDADKRVAELFGISVAHSVLLRRINDGQPGAPTHVITHPEQALGDQAATVLAFWRHLDRMTASYWEAAWEAAGAAAGAPAGASAGGAVGGAGGAGVEAGGLPAGASAWAGQGEAEGASAWEAAGEAAGATNEIQGARVMRKRNQPLFFLPLFGFADPEAVLAADALHQEALT